MAVGLGLALVVGCDCRAQSVTITQVGSLGDARAVSSDGATVAGRGTGNEAFRWTRAGGLASLGDLRGSANSRAEAVSADGSVVVGTGDLSVRPEAFRWTASGGLLGLGFSANPADSPESRAYGVSADGAIVVGSVRVKLDTTHYEAFRWTATGGMTTIGMLPGDFESQANAISADGSVIVGYSSGTSHGTAFRWTAGGGMQGLGDLPGGAEGSSALAVSADGNTVVGSGTSASGTEAFRWTAGEGMVGLGELAGGYFYSAAFGVSRDGSVIVGNSNAAAGDTAFIWTRTTGMVSLKSYLAARNVDVSNWEFTHAHGISADGSSIAGNGYFQGSYTLFVITGLSSSPTSSPPQITAQPVDANAPESGSASFAVTATGNPTPTYQWYRNGAAMAGETNSTLTLSNVVAADSGAKFHVVVSNVAGSVTSNQVTLVVSLAPIAPQISSQPQNQIVVVGASAVFSVTATGRPEPTYQWIKDGNAIAGATSASLSIPSARTADAGGYSVRVTNSAGSTVSVTATLTVNAPTPPASTGGSSGGGGGGAPSYWFFGALIATALAGWRSRRP